MISKETKEMLRDNLRVPMLEISKARMYALNVMSKIEESEFELRRIDLAIDMDDREAAKVIEDMDVDIAENFIQSVSMLSYIRIPEKFKKYAENIKETYGIGLKTLMDY